MAKHRKRFKPRYRNLRRVGDRGTPLATQPMHVLQRKRADGDIEHVAVREQPTATPAEPIRLEHYALTVPLLDKVDSLPDRTDDGSRLAPAGWVQEWGTGQDVRVPLPTGVKGERYKAPNAFRLPAIPEPNTGVHYMQLGAPIASMPTYASIRQAQALQRLAERLDTWAGDSAGNDLDAAIAACEIVADIRAAITAASVTPGSIRAGELLVVAESATTSKPKRVHTATSPEVAAMTAELLKAIFG